MASDLARDNRKMESASNAFPFMSLCANTYWKSQRRCRLLSLYIHAIVDASDREIGNLLESIIRHRLVFIPRNLWLGVIVLIPCSHGAAACTAPRLARRIVSELGGTSVQFPQMAPFPKLPSSRPLALSDDAESIIRCVRAAPVSTTPVGGTVIEWPFLHGSLILTQAPRLITMGTFHRVLDLINDFFSSPSISPPPSPFFSPSSAPAPLIFPAPEPITRPPQGPGLHNRVSSWPSYSAELLNWYVFYITVGVLDSQMKVRTSVLVIDWKKLICAQLPFWDETLWFSEEMKLL